MSIFPLKLKDEQWNRTKRILISVSLERERGGRGKERERGGEGEREYK